MYEWQENGIGMILTWIFDVMRPELDLSSGMTVTYLTLSSEASICCFLGWLVTENWVNLCSFLTEVQQTCTWMRESDLMVEKWLFIQFPQQFPQFSTPLETESDFNNSSNLTKFVLIALIYHHRRHHHAKVVRVSKSHDIWDSLALHWE